MRTARPVIAGRVWDRRREDRAVKFARPSHRRLLSEEAAQRFTRLRRQRLRLPPCRPAHGLEQVQGARARPATATEALPIDDPARNRASQEIRRQSGHRFVLGTARGARDKLVCAVVGECASTGHERAQHPAACDRHPRQHACRRSEPVWQPATHARLPPTTRVHRTTLRLRTSEPSWVRRPANTARAVRPEAIDRPEGADILIPRPASTLPWK